MTGALSGGPILPVVFPVNIVDCATSGDLGTGEISWQMSDPDGPDADTNPEGQEYIVPLCKTAAGSFMVLDLDGTMNNCDDEVISNFKTQFAAFPGEPVGQRQQLCQGDGRRGQRKAGGPVLIPICDGECTTTGGSNATYHVIRVVAFYSTTCPTRTADRTRPVRATGRPSSPSPATEQQLPGRLVRPLHLEGSSHRRPYPGSRRDRHPAREVTERRPPAAYVNRQASAAGWPGMDSTTDRGDAVRLHVRPDDANRRTPGRPRCPTDR